MSGADTALVARHHESLSAYVRSLVDSPPLAADIVQETWLRAIPSLRAGSVDNVRAFLYRVARNLVADAARDRRKWSPYFTDDSLAAFVPDDAPMAERRAIARDRLALVMQLVSELPPRCREAFAMRKIEGLTQAEIADRLGITRGMVEKHLRNALMLLATRLGDIDDASNRS